MNPELDPDVKTEEEHVDRDRRPFLLVLMGLAGILTIALIVSADQSYAGIDGLRAITAYPPASEQDPPQNGSIPVLSGLLDGIRELPIFGPAPAASPSDAPAPAGGSAAPAVPVQAVQPVRSTPPVAVTPGPSAPPTAAPSTPTPTPAPAATPTPMAPAPAPAPSATPSVTPTPTPSPTPTPGLALTTDRGATAAVSLGDLVPGDSVVRPITLKNTGTVGFRYVVSATQTASTLLWTDMTYGLQLTVATSAGTVLFSGPLSGLGSLASSTTLAPGDIELLRYTFDFPAAAPGTLQGLLQDLTLVFTASQYP